MYNKTMDADTPTAPATFKTLAAGMQIRVRGRRLDVTGTVAAVTDGLVCFVGKRGVEHTLVINVKETAVTALIGSASRCHRVDAIELA